MQIRPKNVVVVDDDPHFVRFVAQVLDSRFAGQLVVHKMTDPVDAREWIRRHVCDVLISDVDMTPIDGLELARFAKQQNQWTSVIAMSASSSMDRLLDVVDVGAFDYLAKPFNAHQLESVMLHLCMRFARWTEVLSATGFGRKRISSSHRSESKLTARTRN